MVHPAAVPPGLTLVCCHYLGGSAREWNALARQLDATIEVVAVDLPGFGDASSVPGYSVEEMVQYVAAVVRARRFRPWALVGHSMGGKLAAILARRAEDGAADLDGLLAMVLVAGSPPSPEPMKEAKRAELLAMFSGDEAACESDARHYVTQNTGPEMPDQQRQIALADALRSNRAAWRAWLESGSKEDWSDRVGVLQTPTLIVTGENDAGLGTAAQERFTAPHLKHCRLVELEGAGHLLPLERAKVLAQLIQQHLQASAQPTRTSSSSGGDYAALIASSRVGWRTRAALQARISEQHQDADAAVLSEYETDLLRALLHCVIPQQHGDFDLTMQILQLLQEAKGDGWRSATLPRDRVAYRNGLATLDEGARQIHGTDFVALPHDQQQSMLREVADGRATWQSPKDSPDQSLSAAQLCTWFEDVRADAVRLYVAHPATLERIGYSGIANGGDGMPKSGFRALGVGVREAWEPVALRDCRA